MCTSTGSGEIPVCTVREDPPTIHIRPRPYRQSTSEKIISAKTHTPVLYFGQARPRSHSIKQKRLWFRRFGCSHMEFEDRRSRRCWMPSVRLIFADAEQIDSSHFSNHFIVRERCNRQWVCCLGVRKRSELGHRLITEGSLREAGRRFRPAVLDRHPYCGGFGIEYSETEDRRMRRFGGGFGEYQLRQAQHQRVRIRYVQEIHQRPERQRSYERYHFGDDQRRRSSSTLRLSPTRVGHQIVGFRDSCSPRRIGKKTETAKRSKSKISMSRRWKWF